MHTNWSILTGAAAGAGAMFLFDPNRGARRRALMRDKIIRAGHTTADVLDTTARDMAHRAQGAAAEIGGLARDARADGTRLAARVRAELGRVTSHPRAISVEAQDGHVRLVGPILAGEADSVIAAIRAVRGVSSVEDALERHENSDRVPALQGGFTRPGRRSALFQGSWSPSTRAVMSLAGAAIAVGVAMATRRAGSH